MLMLVVIGCGDSKKEEQAPAEDIQAQEMEQPQAEPDTTATMAEAPAEEPAEAASEDAAKPAVAVGTTDNPLKGRAVSLKDAVTGTGVVSKAEAEALVAKGQPMVFLSDGKIYFVYNANGSFASKKLAGFADRSEIGLIGKSKVVNGLNIFIADKIVPTKR